MDLDQLLGDLNVKDSPPKKGVFSSGRDKEKKDDWGDIDMKMEPKNAVKKINSAQNVKQKDKDSNDDWGDTGVIKEEDKKDILSSVSSDLNSKEEKKTQQ